jgi:TM2 domain-containing membrane protein YozV
MYKVIGADGQQYGPVDAEQMRRWIAEGRVRGETLVQPEGATDWKPLQAFPELGTQSPDRPSAAGVPPVFAPPQATVGMRASNKIPAGICGILLGGFGVHKFILGYSSAGGIMLAVSLCSILGGFITCGLLWPGVGIMHLIGIIEGIIYLTKSDEEFVRLYVDGRKEWF